jgi:hypothetical protein
VAVAEDTASPNPDPVEASVAAVVVAPVVAPWPVALPMLNDPGWGERQARRSPIAPPVVLSAGLNLPLVADVPSPRVVLVVVDWTLAASPVTARTLTVETLETAVRYACLPQWESYRWPTSIDGPSTAFCMVCRWLAQSLWTYWRICCHLRGPRLSRRGARAPDWSPCPGKPPVPWRSGV